MATQTPPSCILEEILGYYGNEVVSLQGASQVHLVSTTSMAIYTAPEQTPGQLNGCYDNEPAFSPGAPQSPQTWLDIAHIQTPPRYAHGECMGTLLANRPFLKWSPTNPPWTPTARPPSWLQAITSYCHPCRLHQWPLLSKPHGHHSRIFLDRIVQLRSRRALGTQLFLLHNHLYPDLRRHLQTLPRVRSANVRMAPRRSRSRR